MTLSKTQMELLKRVGSFDHGCPMRVGEIWAPMRRLLRRRMVEFYAPRKSPGWRYLRLTDTGRNALKTRAR